MHMSIYVLQYLPLFYLPRQFFCLPLSHIDISGVKEMEEMEELEELEELEGVKL